MTSISAKSCQMTGFVYAGAAAKGDSWEGAAVAGGEAPVSGRQAPVTRPAADGQGPTAVHVLTRA